MTIQTEKWEEVKSFIDTYIKDERRRIKLVKSMIGLLSNDSADGILEEYIIKVHRDNLGTEDFNYSPDDSEIYPRRPKKST